MELIGSFNLGVKMRLKMRKNGRAVEWLIDDLVVYAYAGEWPRVGWRLGAYFGGDEPAPTSLYINIWK